MAAVLKPGDSARFIMPDIEGVILEKKFEVDPETGEPVGMCLLEWVDAEGETQQRWFEQSKLEIVK